MDVEKCFFACLCGVTTIVVRKVGDASSVKGSIYLVMGTQAQINDWI